MKKYILSAIWTTSSVLTLEVNAENKEDAFEKANMGEYDVIDECYNLLTDNNKLEDLQVEEVEEMSK